MSATINRVGIVGAGVMGAGLAQDAAEHGLEVVLVDVSEEALADARRRIRRDVRLFGMLRAQAGAPRPDPREVLERVHGTLDLGELASVDLVLENVTEDEVMKAAVIEAIGRACARDVVIAADTSCVPIARLAAGLASPERLIGTHFMNPVPLKPVVEVIRGPLTSDATLAATEALLAQLGKRALVVRDAPGFVSNRVLMLAVNEAARVVEEGTADALEVDRIFRECMGHAMGPLETADLIGLDTVLRSLEVLARHVDAARFAPAALLSRLVAEGHLGQKSGRGFHDHGGPR